MSDIICDHCSTYLIATQDLLEGTKIWACLNCGRERQTSLNELKNWSLLRTAQKSWLSDQMNVAKNWQIR
jgi:DNA-directed RNA polymerase subunit M/transcription elongation factor TFIIS